VRGGMGRSEGTAASAEGSAGLPELFPDRRVGDVIDNLFRLPGRVLASDLGGAHHEAVCPPNPEWVLPLTQVALA